MTQSSPSYTAFDILERRPDAVRLFIRLTPKAAANRLDRVEMDGDGQARLRVSVTAVPEKGKANKALMALLAKELGLAKRDISILAGTVSRLKTVEISGNAQSLLDDIGKILKQQGFID